MNAKVDILATVRRAQIYAGSLTLKHGIASLLFISVKILSRASPGQTKNWPTLTRESLSFELAILLDTVAIGRIRQN